MTKEPDLSEFYSTSQLPEEKTYDLSEFYEPAALEEEPGFFQKAGTLAKGAAAGALGAIPDTLALPYNLMAQMGESAEEARKGYEAEYPKTAAYRRALDPMQWIRKVAGTEHIPQIPSATAAIERGLSHIGGETPEGMEHLQKGAEFAGSLVGPGGLAKGATKLGKEALAKGLGAIGATKPSELLGAGVAGTTLSKLQEEGYGAPAAFLGSLGAGSLATGALKGLKGIKTVKEEAIPQLLSVGAHPNAKAIEAAQKEGITLPFNVQLQSKLGNFLANAYLRSVAASDKYRQVVKSADQKMINTVKDKINAVSPEFKSKYIASEEHRKALTEEQKRVKDVSDQLYNDAYNELTNVDKVKPTHLINKINAMKPELMSPSPGAERGKALKRISEIADAYGFGSKHLKGIENLSPQAYQQVLKEITSSKHLKDVPVTDLINLRSDILSDIRKGHTYLAPLVEPIMNDIEALSKETFKDKWKTANQFYRNERINRVQTDFADSLVNDQFPKEAYNYMDSPRHIAELERMLGTSPATKQVMDTLKRSKLQDIILKRIEPQKNVMSYANFAQLFHKRSGEKDLFTALLGNKNFEKLEELSEIAHEYVKSGREFANPPSSALIKEDFDKIGKFMAGSLFFGTLGIANPNVLSRLVSNQKIVDRAVELAKARRAGNLKEANKVQKEMRQIYLQTILPQIRASQESKETSE